MQLIPILWDLCLSYTAWKQVTVETTPQLKECSEDTWQQEIPSTWKPYIRQFLWPPLDVTPGGRQMNKFEKDSSDHHQMSPVGRFQI